MSVTQQNIGGGTSYFTTGMGIFSRPDAVMPFNAHTTVTSGTSKTIRYMVFDNPIGA
jgi:hypothetical protein